MIVGLFFRISYWEDMLSCLDLTLACVLFLFSPLTRSYSFIILSDCIYKPL